MSQKCEIDGGSIFEDYTCELNQVDISRNANKFYIIQIVKTSSNSFYLCTRHGRVGLHGVASKSELSKDTCILSFEKLFRDKTGISWDNRNTLSSKPGKYTYMKIVGHVKSPNVAKTVVVNVPQLVGVHKDVVTTLTEICSRQLMETTLKTNLNIDTKKMPLGMIHKSQLDNAEEILRKLEHLVITYPRNVRTQDVQSQLINLSNQYWTLIPRASKTNKPLEIIDNITTIQSLADELDNLKSIQIASDMLERTTNLDKLYKEINCDMEECSIAELTLLKEMCDTASKNHMPIRLVSAIKVDKSELEENDKNNNFEKVGNFAYLFHGSITANWMAILKEGLRIPKPEQVSNGSTLGKGCYFADCITKSANYCRLEKSGDCGYILVAKVALGRQHKVYGCFCDGLDMKIYDSRMGVGRFSTPSIRVDGVMYPINEPVITQTTSSFNFNEYVIFDATQYRIKYLVKVERI